jgi:hypothetical protein
MLMVAWANSGLIAHRLTTVSLALATMAASSSSVMSMARLNWVVSVVLKVGLHHRHPVFCGADLAPSSAFALILAADEPCLFN